MADKTFGVHVPFGTAPSKRQLRLIKRRSALMAWNQELRAARPECKLDAQAKELGVHDTAYHCMSRKERKRVVAGAHSKQQRAA